jgi:cytochrome c oxidase assembly protein subunit 15
MNSPLALFSKIHVLSVFFLILMGALVKSHEAGLSVPDWPTSYGENMFTFPPSKWIGGIVYEHVHRLIASGVGLLTLILTLWVAVVETRRSVKIIAFSLLALVVIQGVLGGLTVLYGLPDIVSVAHGVLAQTFLLVSTVLAYMLSKEFATSAPRNTSLKPGINSIILIYIQLILGAFMRHAEAGLAIMDFPKMAGSWLPSLSPETLKNINEARVAQHLALVTENQVLLNLLHRAGAVIVVLGVLHVASSLFVQAKRYGDTKLKSAALMIMVTVAAQFILGATTIWTERQPWVASLHVFFGAFLLFSATLLTLRLWRKANYSNS